MMGGSLCVRHEVVSGRIDQYRSTSVFQRSLRCLLITSCCALMHLVGCRTPIEPPANGELALEEPSSRALETSKRPIESWESQVAELRQAQETLSADPRDLDAVYQALRTLERRSRSLPTVSSIINLKRAEVWSSLGRWSKSTASIRTLPLDDLAIQYEASRLMLSSASQCEHLDEVLKLLSQRRESSERAELISQAQLKYAASCQSTSDYERALVSVARSAPRSLSQDELIEVSVRSSPREVLELSKVWERARLPHVSVRALQLLSDRPSLSEAERWEADFERERVVIERLRDHYDSAITTLRRLTQYSGERGRRARLLLGEAFAKSGQDKRAIKTYRDLIEEWSFSAEAKTARFRIAFLQYERGSYRRASEGFAELCRHRGKARQLKRYPHRAKRGTLTQNAEWYYAWTLYLSDDERAATFLEAQIGRGLPTTPEGRRAAYWAARALERGNPDRASQYRAQLLAGHWGDWYSLLLRAEDPSLAADIKPWPALPSFNPPKRSPLPIGVSSVKTSKVKPQPKVHVSPLELAAQRADVAQTLGLTELAKRYRAQVRVELRHQLRSHRDVDPDLVAWGQELSLHRELLRWALSQSGERRRQPPQLSEAQWWMLLYPRAFNDEVKRASQSAGVSQVKLLSFIYKESAFDPQAISHAYAMGLMQLLEKTARALHPDEPPADLLNPGVNVQLGAEYLSLLSARFHDQLPIVAAGYNAGPSHLVGWLDRHRARGQRKLDRFIEEIPFKEARNYAKRLVALYCAYALLYDQLSINQCAASLPLTLNMSVGPGVAF